MPGLAAALAQELDEFNVETHDTKHIEHSYLAPDVAPQVMGNLLRNHSRRIGAGFLDAHANHELLIPPDLPSSQNTDAPNVHSLQIRDGLKIAAELRTSLLLQNAAPVGADLSASSVGTTHLIGPAAAGLAYPLIKPRRTSFDNCGKVFGECHNHFWGDYAPKVHDYGVDIKPLGVRDILRMAFSSVANIAENALGPHAMVHILTALALMAIWADWELPELKIPNVPKLVGGMITGIGVVAEGVWKTAKMTAEGIKVATKGMIAAAKVGFKAIGTAAKFTVKAIGKGFEALGKGLELGAKVMWKGIKLAVKGIGKGLELAWGGIKLAAKKIPWKKIGKGLELAAKMAWKATKFAAKWAWKGTKFAAKMAWKGTKLAAKGLYHGARLLGTGLVKAVNLLDKAVRNTGKGILFVGNLVKKAPWKKIAAGLGIAAVVGLGALALISGMRNRSGRGRTNWGSKSGKKGRRGSRGNARAEAAKEAAEREAERKAAERRRAARAEEEQIYYGEKKKRLVNHVPEKQRRKKQGVDMEDLLAMQRANINAQHKHGHHASETGIENWGNRAVGAAAAAAAGGAMMLGNMVPGRSKHQASGQELTDHEHEDDGIQNGIGTPGGVVLGKPVQGERIYQGRPALGKHGAHGNAASKYPGPQPRRIPAVPDDHAVAAESEGEGKDIRGNGGEHADGRGGAAKSSEGGGKDTNGEPAEDRGGAGNHGSLTESSEGGTRNNQGEHGQANKADETRKKHMDEEVDQIAREIKEDVEQDRELQQADKTLGKRTGESANLLAGERKESSELDREMQQDLLAGERKESFEQDRELQQADKTLGKRTGERANLLAGERKESFQDRELQQAGAEFDRRQNRSRGPPWTRTADGVYRANLQPHEAARLRQELQMEDQFGRQPHIDGSTAQSEILEVQETSERGEAATVAAQQRADAERILREGCASGSIRRGCPSLSSRQKLAIADAGLERRSQILEARDIRLQNQRRREMDLAGGEFASNGTTALAGKVGHKDRASAMDFQRAHAMSDRELNELAYKRAGYAQPKHDRRTIRHVSSSLAIPPFHQPTARASAFLDHGSQSEDDEVLSAHGASVYDGTHCTTVEYDFGEASLYPLYYLDKDGQALDFLDPTRLHHSLRRLAFRPEGLGSLFLEVPITKQQLQSSRLAYADT